MENQISWFIFLFIYLFCLFVSSLQNRIFRLNQDPPLSPHFNNSISPSPLHLHTNTLLTLFFFFCCCCCCCCFLNFPTPLPLEWWDAVLLKRLAWALFILLLSTCVVVSQQRWFWAFLFHKFSDFTPPPQFHTATRAVDTINASIQDISERTQNAMATAEVNVSVLKESVSTIKVLRRDKIRASLRFE